jgi:hypothetical protein
MAESSMKWAQVGYEYHQFGGLCAVEIHPVRRLIGILPVVLAVVIHPKIWRV